MLTESRNPQTYWRVLKKRLLDEGNQTVAHCNGLKMKSADGKMRLTDAGTTEQILRLVQSIPSPKAEPFKLRLTQVGKERIDEMFDPELAIEEEGGGCAKRRRGRIGAHPIATTECNRPSA